MIEDRGSRIDEGRDEDRDEDRDKVILDFGFWMKEQKRGIAREHDYRNNINQR